MTLTPATKSVAPVSVAALRDGIVARVHAMTEEELRRLATTLATVGDETELEDWERAYLAEAPAGAQVIRYGEQRIRLTTDPPERPPYGPVQTEGEFLNEIEASSTEVREGRGIPAEQALAELRSMLP